MATYKPSGNFQLAFGSPVPLAFDWRVTQKLDIGARIAYMGSWFYEGYTRYHFSPKRYIGIHLVDAFDHNMESGYFAPRSFDNDLEYTHMKQYQTNIMLEYGFRASPTIGTVISAGYRKGSTINLYNNLNKIGNINGRELFFVGIAFQFMDIPR
jgi:hypothetical protein